MAVLRYLSHPQVQIDPAVPVPDWSLSEYGRNRIRALRGVNWLADTNYIVSSAERKACETAEIIAGTLGLTPHIDRALNEIDRSSTGYLSHDRHEELADAFFADPDSSAEGWECASDVQRRGLAAIRQYVSPHNGPGDVLIIGHGGIGTMCWCALSGTDPRGRPDQPPGGGAVWSASLPDLRPLHAWCSIEEMKTG